MQNELALYTSLVDLSTRTENLLLKNPKINSTSKLLKSYKANNNFLKIRGCGKKSNSELIELCQKILQHDVIDDKYRPNIYISDLPGRIQNLLIALVEKKYQTLSIRAQELFDEYIPNKKSIYEIEQFLLKDISKAVDRPNIGTRTLNELNQLKSFVLDLYYKVQLDQKESEIDEFELVIEVLNLDPAVNKFLRESTREKEHFPFFKFCDLILSKSSVFNDTEKYIINNYFQYHLGHKKKKMLSDIGKDLDLTRERVRQVRNEIIDNFQSKLNFTSIVSPMVDFENDYGLNFKNNFLFINNNVSQINNKDGTNLTAVLIAKFILLLKHDYQLLGFELNYHTKQQKRSELILNGVYILESYFSDKFNAKNFITEIKEIQNKGVSETYRVGIKGYVSQYIQDFDFDNDFQVLEDAVNLCIEIIIYETSFQVSSDNDIIFLRNKKRSNTQLVKKAIEELGYSPKGHHISKVAEKIEQIEPSKGLHKKHESIRSVVINNTNTFVSIGRTSTYGLKKWQDEFSEFRGGTIRDIVEEFLDKFNEPKHISTITNYVNNFRDTDDANIRGNILLDQSKTFKIFPHGFYGLKKKDYSVTDLDFNEVHGGYFTEMALKNYLPEYYDSLIEKLASSLEVKKVQVKSVIDKKIKEGSLVKKANNILTLVNR